MFIVIINYKFLIYVKNNVLLFFIENFHFSQYELYN